jgi:hypothetical protein
MGIDVTPNIDMGQNGKRSIDAFDQMLVPRTISRHSAKLIVPPPATFGGKNRGESMGVMWVPPFASS